MQRRLGLAGSFGVMWLLVQLVLGQHFALVHMIGHSGDALRIAAHDAAAVTHADDDDEEHTPAHSLSHVCTGCISAGGINTPVAYVVSALPVLEFAFFVAAIAVSPAPTLAPYSPFRGRAPPILPS
jgi:hypothetical protein